MTNQPVINTKKKKKKIVQDAKVIQRMLVFGGLGIVKSWPVVDMYMVNNWSWFDDTLLREGHN